MSDEADPAAPPGEAGEQLSTTSDLASDPPSGEQPEAADDDESINQDEARVGEDEKESLLGSQYERQKFGRNRASGPSMWGNGNIQNIFSSQTGATFRRPAGIDGLTDWYRPTDESEEKALRDGLDRHTTVCLSGDPETGRFSTACAALVERFGADGVEEIILPPGQLSEAVHQLSADDLRPDRGYLLRIENSDPDPIIRSLDALMHAQNARLVLIRDLPKRAALRGDAEIQHQPPRSADVFSAHVRRFGAQSGREVSDYVRLASTVPLSGKPRHVVWQAIEALRHTVTDAERVLVEQNREKLREKAEKLLGADGDNGRSARRRLPQHRRAFRIAYAAMAGRPIGHVFDATGWLLAKLDAESGWSDLGRTALEHSVAALLGEELAKTWQSSGNPSRLARIDDDLVGAIFDVAWHEFDHTRPALLAWLESMAGSTDEASREAAVRAAVRLALVDFGGIWRTVIEDWSRSPKTRVRLSAARVVLFLSSANRVKHVVARRVHGWVQGSSNYQRDTAAWAYAGGLRLSDPRWILADLRRIAADPTQRSRGTVAMAVSELLRPELRGLIIETLAGWIRSDAPDRVATRHAASSLTWMLDTPHENRLGAPPTLLLGLSDGAFRVRDLSLLWYAALLGRSTRRDGWNGLLGWLRRADADPDLRRPVEDMLRDMAGSAALRARMLRCLSRSDTPDWINVVIKEWTN